MVLRNFIELETDVPARLHLTDHALVDKEITDPLTRQPKTATALVFTVDRLNGEPVAATWSVIQEKLAARLEPWLEGKRYRDVDLIITRRGTGFLTNWSVEPAPRG